MFAYLRGRLITKTPTLVVVDISGIGYEVHIPLSTYDRLPNTGEEVFLYVFPFYRPEKVTLCGFATLEEKNLFNLLLGVTGVGPKLGLTILSGTSVANFRDAIVSGDEKALSAISGIGKKLSLRLITELKDQMGTLGPSEAGEESPLERQAVGALTTLGYSRAQSFKAVQGVLRSKKPKSLEELLKEALKKI